jgi:hypothetical protein
MIFLLSITIIINIAFILSIFYILSDLQKRQKRILMFLRKLVEDLKMEGGINEN